MKKFTLASIGGALSMFTAFTAYSMFEMWYFGPSIYKNPMYIDYSQGGMETFLIGFIFLKLAHAFLLTYLHEKIPRCGPGLWSKIWKFSLLSFFLVHVPGLGMTYLTMTIPPELITSWAFGGLLQTFAGCLVIIPICYRFPAPDGNCKFVPKKK